MSNPARLPRSAKKIHEMSHAIAAERVRIFKLGVDARGYVGQALHVVGGGYLYSHWGWLGVSLAAGYYALTALVAGLSYWKAKKAGV